MRSRVYSFWGRIQCAFLSGMLIVGTSCGGGGGGGGGGSVSPQAAALNNQELEVNQKALAYAQAYAGFIGANLTSLTAAQIQSAINAYVQAGGDFATEVEAYSDLLVAYGNDFAAIKSQSFGGADSLTTVNDVRSLIQTAKDGEAQCAQQFHVGEVDEDLAGYKDCIDQLRKTSLANVANTGVGGVVGGGVGAVAGLAASAAGATLLVSFGVAAGVGLVAGVVWNWCTSSPPSQIHWGKNAVSGEFCTFNSHQGAVTEDANGNNIAVFGLPQGTGTVSIHVGGAVFVREITIGPNGTTINLSEACLNGDDAACNSETTVSDGATVQSDNCSVITALVATASPPDPAPNESVNVTAEVLPNVSGCDVDFSIVGTDGFSKSETLTTDSSGVAGPFFIPGATESVVDTVTIMVNSISRDLVYTF